MLPRPRCGGTRRGRPAVRGGRGGGGRPRDRTAGGRRPRTDGGLSLARDGRGGRRSSSRRGGPVAGGRPLTAQKRRDGGRRLRCGARRTRRPPVSPPRTRGTRRTPVVVAAGNGGRRSSPRGGPAGRRSSPASRRWNGGRRSSRLARGTGGRRSSPPRGGQGGAPPRAAGAAWPAGAGPHSSAGAGRGDAVVARPAGRGGRAGRGSPARARGALPLARGRGTPPPAVVPGAFVAAAASGRPSLGAAARSASRFRAPRPPVAAPPCGPLILRSLHQDMDPRRQLRQAPLHLGPQLLDAEPARQVMQDDRLVVELGPPVRAMSPRWRCLKRSPLSRCSSPRKVHSTISTLLRKIRGSISKIRGPVSPQ